MPNRCFLTALTFFVASTLVAPCQSAGLGSPQAVLDKFAANFSTVDVEAMVALFRPDATFFGSRMPNLLRGKEGARTYFTTVWTNAAAGANTMKCEPPVLQQPAADVALFATVCTLTRNEQSASVRTSGALMRDTDGWRFAEIHVSAPPR